MRRLAEATGPQRFSRRGRASQYRFDEPLQTIVTRNEGGKAHFPQLSVMFVHHSHETLETRRREMPHVRGPAAVEHGEDIFFRTLDNRPFEFSESHLTQHAGEDHCVRHALRFDQAAAIMPEALQSDSTLKDDRLGVAPRHRQPVLLRRTIHCARGRFGLDVTCHFPVPSSLTSA